MEIVLLIGKFLKVQLKIIFFLQKYLNVCIHAML